MGKSLSQDLRDPFKQLMDRGQCAAAAGKILLISPATAACWGKKVRHGLSLIPQPSGRKTGTGKRAIYMDFFVELLEQDADITLHELRGALYEAKGVTCHPLYS